MRDVIFITGGQRSGKSRFALELAERLSPQPIYLATARHWDDDFTKRIERHQAERGNHWRTVEEEKNLHQLGLEGETVLLDCVTLWLTNIFHHNSYNLEASQAEAECIWQTLAEQTGPLIVVSNEIGMCLHAPDAVSRKFTDLQGWMNQRIAVVATDVYLVVSGIPVKVK